MDHERHRVLIESPSTDLKYSVQLPSAVTNVFGASLDWIRFYDSSGNRVKVFDDEKVPYITVDVDPFYGSWKQSTVEAARSSLAVIDREDYVSSREVDVVCRSSISRVSRLNIVVGGPATKLSGLRHVLSLTIYTDCKGT